MCVCVVVGGAGCVWIGVGGSGRRRSRFVGGGGLGLSRYPRLFTGVGIGGKHVCTDWAVSLTPPPPPIHTKRRTRIHMTALC